MQQKVELGFGLEFEELYTREGLIRLDQQFLDYLQQRDLKLFNDLMQLRKDKESLDSKDTSNVLIDIAVILDEFIAELFAIQTETETLRKKHGSNIYECKVLFVKRKALKLHKDKDYSQIQAETIREQLKEIFQANFNEENFANHIMFWLENEQDNHDNLVLAAQYALWASHTAEGRKYHANSVLYRLPQKTDYDNLVPVTTEVVDGVRLLKLEEHIEDREGFGLTDKGFSLEYAVDHANYCIYCHNQGKDSCSKGLKTKDKQDFQISPTKVTLHGCPLEQKISEMNKVKFMGYSIGALAIITIDNPMCAGTGYRICNDCSKACIYQKQDPVNIPAIESKSLENVLELPWGFEIYSLLTRWNPLNIDRPLPKQETSYKILTVGLGPAGFTLAHHLLNDGHVVVGIDGLKIEPLPENISGIDTDGNRVPFDAIRDVKKELYEKLDQRVLSGFGGVAEYGITVRWNKNYLKVLRLLLERRGNFRMYGGVRFGSTITYQQAFDMGFDHIALAMGAGKPTVLNIPNSLAKGVRTASDFLMSLQLTGASKKDSLANLQIRLPIVVIGGGLTGIDATTESLEYYKVQVEKFLARYEILVENFGKEYVTQRWNEEDKEIATEFISHAKAIREERLQAKNEGRETNIIALLKKWGGSTLAYRKKLVDSPAYRLNHEEVSFALEEGIMFLENATPLEVILDKYGAASHLKMKIDSEIKLVPAKTVLVAAGTSPNTVLAKEETEHFALDGKYFQAIDLEGKQVSPEWSAKPKTVEVFVSRYNGRFVSFLGDLHPSYAGNVVRAMASAKQSYPFITQALEKKPPLSEQQVPVFFSTLDNKLIATVHQVNRLTHNIIEIVVKAPQAVANFKPGQFYRLQNYETNAKLGKHNTQLIMEGLAVTGASIVGDGLLSTIILEMGGSSNLCDLLQPGEKVVLMGPTGTPTEIPGNDIALLVGGGLGNAVLFSIGKAMKEAGTKVLYFAGYRNACDRYKIGEIEQASDQIVWCCDEASFKPERQQDKAFHGNIVQAMLAYAKGELGEGLIKLGDVNHIITIGSDRMMRAVKEARYNELKPYLKEKHTAIGSINSPMQCMMKEICAQCLQKHVDIDTGQEKYVYSCFNQDQNLDEVDFEHLNDRLAQNRLQENLTARWIEYCIA